MTRSRQVLASAIGIAVVAVAAVGVLQATASSGPSAPSIEPATDSSGGRADVPANETRLADWPGMGGDPERDERLYAEEYAAREVMTQACMASAGLTYQPISLSPSAGDELPMDPNAALMAALSATEYREYSMALAGVPDANDPGQSFEMDAQGSGGCIGEAHRSLPGVFLAPRELRGAMHEVRAAVADSAEARSGLNRWRDCLVDVFPELLADVELSDPGDVRRLQDEGELERLLGRERSRQMIEQDLSCRAEVDEALNRGSTDAVGGREGLILGLVGCAHAVRCLRWLAV